jgi:rhamnulokinase
MLAITCPQNRLRAPPPVIAKVLARVPARELYERTRIQILPINTVYELAAMVAEGDPAIDGAETLLMIPDLLHYWLAGARVGEWTNATSTQCLDARTRRWAEEYARRQVGEIQDRIFPLHGL